MENEDDNTLRVPKVIGVVVQKAVDLELHRPEKPIKKPSTEWRVIFTRTKEKLATPLVNSVLGNPVWNCEAELTLRNPRDPVVLLVADARSRHIGQAIIPLVRIQPRPQPSSAATNANGGAVASTLTPTVKPPLYESQLCCMELEATRNNSQPRGKLFFWMWAERYWTAAELEKHAAVAGSKGRRVASLSAISRSLSKFSRSTLNLFTRTKGKNSRKAEGGTAEAAVNRRQSELCHRVASQSDESDDGQMIGGSPTSQHANSLGPTRLADVKKANKQQKLRAQNPRKAATLSNYSGGSSRSNNAATTTTAAAASRNPFGDEELNDYQQQQQQQNGPSYAAHTAQIHAYAEQRREREQEEEERRTLNQSQLRGHRAGVYSDTSFLPAMTGGGVGVENAGLGGAAGGTAGNHVIRAQSFQRGGVAAAALPPPVIGVTDVNGEDSITHRMNARPFSQDFCGALPPPHPSHHSINADDASIGTPQRTLQFEKEKLSRLNVQLQLEISELKEKLVDKEKEVIAEHELRAKAESQLQTVSDELFQLRMTLLESSNGAVFLEKFQRTRSSRRKSHR